MPVSNGENRLDEPCVLHERNNLQNSMIQNKHTFILIRLKGLWKKNAKYKKKFHFVIESTSLKVACMFTRSDRRLCKLKWFISFWAWTLEKLEENYGVRLGKYLVGKRCGSSNTALGTRTNLMMGKVSIWNVWFFLRKRKYQTRRTVQVFQISVRGPSSVNNIYRNKWLLVIRVTIRAVSFLIVSVDIIDHRQSSFVSTYGPTTSCLPACKCDSTGTYLQVSQDSERRKLQAMISCHLNKPEGRRAVHNYSLTEVSRYENKLQKLFLMLVL